MKIMQFKALILTALLMIPTLTYAEGKTEIKINVGNEPCARHQTEPCPDVAVWPSAHIEIFALGGAKVATLNFSYNPTELVAGKKSQEISLQSGDYVALITNTINQQTTSFPVTVYKWAKEMEFNFVLYDSYEQKSIVAKPKEICFESKITAFENVPPLPLSSFVKKLYCNQVTEHL